MAEQDPGLVADGARRGRPGVVAVGLTGGVGAGKSTALAMFGELGALTASADQIVHDLYTQPAFVARMVGQFGPGILDPDGNIDRRRLAEMVKGRRDKLQWLERLTHPLVADEIERIISEAPAGAIVVCEVPLLFESHFEALFDLL
ncbi:MAG TPA: dephospho-CoA kinase, partial [Thermoleophilia bacterium]|nr:dephospho-CoA kinase [Thermoleophilia bacterium]